MGFQVTKDCQGDVYYVASEGPIIHLYPNNEWGCDAAPGHCKSLEEYSAWLEQQRARLS